MDGRAAVQFFLFDVGEGRMTLWRAELRYTSSMGYTSVGLSLYYCE